MRTVPLLLILAIAAAAPLRAEEPAPGKTLAPPTAPAPTPAAPGAPPEFPLRSSAFIGIIDTLDQEDQAETMQVELKAFEEVVLALRASSDEHLKAGINPAIDYRRMMKSPDECRGSVVRVNSVLKLVERYPAPEGNRTGQTLFHRGYAANIRGEIIAFISEEPIPDTIKPQQGISFTGIYLKRWMYVNREPGDDLVTIAPLIIVKRIEPYIDPTESEGMTTSVTHIALAILISGGLIAYAYTRMNARHAKGNVFARRKRARDGDVGNFPSPKK